MRTEGTLAGQDWERLATNLRVEQALLDAMPHFQGVPFAVFKGGVLTRLLHQDLRLRSSADNDVLVRKSDAPAVLGRLLAAGYRALPGLAPERALEREGQVALWPEGDVDRPSLDLHAEAFSSAYFSVAEATVWAHLEHQVIQGREMLVFGPGLSLVHLVAHFFQHLLEPHLLSDLALAFRRVGPTLELPALEALVASTVGAPAYNYALAVALEDSGAGAPLDPLTLKGPIDSALVRSATRFRGARWLRSHPGHLERGLLALLLAGPSKIPRAIQRGFLPETDELVSRYGPGHPLDLLITHWKRRLFG